MNAIKNTLDKFIFRDDAIAGMTGAIAGIPQAMAFALIAGVNPVYGLYAAIVATIIAGFTMESKIMTVSPTNALALAVGSALSLHMADNDPLSYLVALTILIGIFQLLVGLLGLGDLTRFISNAVMTGFIFGAGLLIVLGQLSNLTGITSEGDNAILSFIDWLINIPSIDLYTSIIGIVSVGLIWGLRQTPLKSVGLLITLVIGAGAVWLLNWESVSLVRDISDIPSGLPMPLIPEIGIMRELIVPAIAIGILGLVQSAGVAQSLRERTNTNYSISRDFAGQGIANIVAGLLRGMPSGGSISRTAINVEAGAKTRYANIIAGVLIAIIMLLFTPVIERIPLAALAALLIVSAVNLIDIEDIQTVWQTYPPARYAMVATFISTLILPLEYSIYVGVTLSVVLYVRTASKAATIVQLIRTDDGGFREVEPPQTLPDYDPTVLSIYGDPYFGAVQSLSKQFPRVANAKSPIVVLRLRGLDVVGSTFIVMLRDYARQIKQQDGEIFLSGISNDLKAELEQARLRNLITEEQIFLSRDKLLKATQNALDKAQKEAKQNTNN